MGMRNERWAWCVSGCPASVTHPDRSNGRVRTTRTGAPTARDVQWHPPSRAPPPRPPAPVGSRAARPRSPSARSARSGRAGSRSTSPVRRPGPQRQRAAASGMAASDTALHWAARSRTGCAPQRSTACDWPVHLFASQKRRRHRGEQCARVMLEREEDAGTDDAADAGEGTDRVRRLVEHITLVKPPRSGRARRSGCPARS